MKHIVTLTISNPAHEHVSLRRRQSTTNYMVEARDEAEAIFRASNHFKKLGNYVHNAVIAESVLNEEVEQIDEDKKLAAWKSKVIDKHGDLVKFTKEKHADANTYHTVARVKDKPVGNYMHTKEKGDRGAVFNKRGDWMGEEVEQIDEISSGLARRYGGKAIRAHLTAKAKGDTATADKRAKGINLASAKAYPNSYKPSDKAKVPATNEEVEQIDELSKGTLASYIAKAAPKIRSNTFLKGHFEGQKYGHLKTVRKHSPNVNPNRKHERDPKKKEYAELLAKSAGDLSDKFALKAGNKITGIQRAAAKLAKEEVELDEANARHSPEAAQAVLTPTSKIVRAAVGKTARDKAATKKYARRVAKISPDYSKKDVMDHLKSMGEEVEQIDEVGPQKRMTRLFNKIRDARAGEKFKRSAGMPVPPAEPQHTNVAAHNKAIGRALRKEETVNEKAPPGAKYERMVKHIKDKYSEDGTLTPKEKAIAYATAWKAKNAGK